MEWLTSVAPNPAEWAFPLLLQVLWVAVHVERQRLPPQFAGLQAATSQRGMGVLVRHAADRVELGFLQLTMHSLQGLHFMGVRRAQPQDVTSRHMTEELERNVAGLAVVEQFQHQPAEAGPLQAQRPGPLRPVERPLGGTSLDRLGGERPLGGTSLGRLGGPRQAQRPGPLGHTVEDIPPLLEILKVCDRIALVAGAALSILRQLHWN